MSIETKFEERSLRTADGLTLSFRDYGSRFGTNTPILCLAGLTRNSKDFHDLALKFSANRRIVALDARGRGRSDYDPDYTSYNLIREVSDVLSLLSSEFDRPALIVGTSRGGLQAMILNGVRSDLIAGIVLNDIGPEIEEAGLVRIFSYLGITPDPLNSWDDAVAAMKKTNADAFPTLSEEDWLAWAKRTFREEDGVPHLDYDPKMRDAALEATPQGADFWPQFRGLGDKRVLLLRGENTDLLSIATVQKMRRAKPDMRVVTVRERGHVPFLDEPECLTAINEMLSEIDLKVSM